MAVTSFKKWEAYLGQGNQKAYSFSFKIRSVEDIVIVCMDVTDLLNPVVKWIERGDTLVNVSSVTFDALLGGGTVTLNSNLPTDYRLYIKIADDNPTQEFMFRDQQDFNVRQFENALDQLVMSIQRLVEKSDRSLKFNEAFSEYFATINTELDIPTKDSIFTFDSNGVLKWVPRTTLIPDSLANGLPDGGVAGDVLAKNSSTNGDANWKTYAYDGYSARFGAAFTSTDLDDTLKQILNLSYIAPAVTLSGSTSGTVREKGASVSGITLSAAVTKKSDPIARIQFFKGATSIYDENPALTVGSGTTNYVYGTAFTDSTSFTVQVTDNGATGGPTTITSNTVTYTFVYPYYYGAGATGLSAAAVAALTKDIITAQTNKVVTFTASSGNIFYFAFPASYSDLISILDVNNFETISDWTKTTANITGLDGTPQSYKIYSFNNPVVAGSYQYTFKR